MMVSPGFCLYFFGIKNTGSDVFSFSAHEHNIVCMLKEAAVYFLKIQTLWRSQCFLNCILD